jgi:2-octaprenyl-6-methoxyphenol hydroxylase
MTNYADIVIVGGGPVGAAFALALLGSGYAVTVIESRQRDATIADSRPLALSHGSRLIFDRLGVWDALAPATGILRIHASQRGGFGRVELTAQHEHVPALGYVVDYARLTAALSCALEARGVAVEYGACVNAVRAPPTSVEFNGRTLNAQLIVVADGGVIEGLAPQKCVDYHQTALTAFVQSDTPHTHSAYERFTPDGPLALLPYNDGYALVWTTRAERAEQLCDGTAREFLAALQHEFGTRAGTFTDVTQRARYPLALRYATQIASTGVASIGNAAQSLHPVAGQGFNLGLRDAWELAQLARTTPVHELGSLTTANTQRAQRRVDRCASIATTHGLVQLFSNDYFPLRATRAIGMTLVGCIPPLRDYFARRMIFGARG